jgi:integrase
VPPKLRAYWDDKTEFLLGRTLQQAYLTYSTRVQAEENTRTIGQLLDRYTIEIVPGKKPKSQQSNRISIRRLRSVFSDVPVGLVKPKDAYKFIDLVTKKHGPASANRDYEVLSHALSMAVQWGVIDRNPVKGQVRKNKIKRRERYIENWELEEALKIASPMLRAYIVLKLLTGLRRGDLLRLEVSQLTGEGISVKTGKTDVGLVIEWTEELREAVCACLDARSIDHVSWLFCTRNGNPYVKDDGSANAFDSLWQRFMMKVVTDTNVTERFQEKDLRKKTASDMSLEMAKQLLGHTSASTTRRHYRLTGDRVKPHSIKKSEG